MERGKHICNQLKALRRHIAEENGIPLQQRECTHQGPCRGTCPRCEAEVHYLEQALARRLKLGKAATVAGLSLSLAACGNGNTTPHDTLLTVGDTSLSHQLPDSLPVDSLIPPAPPAEIPPEVTTLGCIVMDDDLHFPMEYPLPKNGERDSFYDNYYTTPPIQAMFPGGPEAMRQWISSRIQIPPQFLKSGIAGEVVARLRIETDGTVSGYRILKSLDGCTPEAERLIRTLPKWSPASIPDKGPVPSIATISIPFILLTGGLDLIAGELPGSEDDDIFTVVEDDPEFPGGMDSLYRWIDEHIQYPQLALENGIHGKVFVTFTVEPDGTISNPRILRDIGGGCGKEAQRVVYLMPRWIPGKLHGEPVRVQFNLPVKFTLPVDTPKEETPN